MAYDEDYSLYEPAIVESGDNPAENLLYEKFDEFVETFDNTVVSGKVYYQFNGDPDTDQIDDSSYYSVVGSPSGDPSSIPLYEYRESYQLTEDTEPAQDKDYYRSIGDTLVLAGESENDRYYPIDIDDEEGDVSNPHQAGLYVLEDGEYVLSDDTVFDETVQYYRPYEEMVDEEEGLDEGLDDMAFSAVPTTDELGGYVREIVQPKEPSSVPAGSLYVRSEITYVGDPSAIGLYEISNGAYVLTSDTEADPYKSYYQRCDISNYREVSVLEGESPWALCLYELLNGDYVMTEDTEIVVNKTYYCYDPVYSDGREFNENPDIDEYAIGDDEGEPVAPE